MCETCDNAKQIIQEWLDKQGHERCWYYPDLFNELAGLLGVEPTKKPNLPPFHEFFAGCCKYQREQYPDDSVPLQHPVNEEIVF